MSSSAVIIKQNRYMRVFRQAGATDPSRAKRLEDLGLRGGWVFQRMEDRDVFRPGPAPETFYIDLGAAEEFVAARRRRAFYMFLLILIGAAVLFFLGRR
jgi:hypothetical protein